MLDVLGEDIWTATRPLRFFGLEVGSRMTVVKLAGGGLFVHSPVALDDATKEAVDALGPVVAIVAPCLFHHLHVEPWAKAYPEATVSCCPGLNEKRADIAWTRTLRDEPAEEWKDTLQQVFFGSLPIQNEIVFFHDKSKTMISSDVIMNLGNHPKLLTRIASYAMGAPKAGPTFIERLLIRDRTAARDQIGRMVAWQPERLVLAHGDVLTSNAGSILEKGYSWL